MCVLLDEQIAGFGFAGSPLPYQGINRHRPSRAVPVTPPCVTRQVIRAAPIFLQRKNRRFSFTKRPNRYATPIGIPAGSRRRRPRRVGPGGTR